jgi:hypothetical protein
MFRTYEDLFLPIGQSRQVGDYVITPLAANRSYSQFEADFAALHDGSRTLEEIQPGNEYFLDDLVVRVTRAPSSGVLPTAHGQAESTAVAAAASDLVCELRPERRYYPKQGSGFPRSASTVASCGTST